MFLSSAYFHINVSFVTTKRRETDFCLTVLQGICGLGYLHEVNLNDSLGSFYSYVKIYTLFLNVI